MTERLPDQESYASVPGSQSGVSEPTSATPVRGVIRGDQGVETAQVWLSAFLVLMAGLGAYWSAWRIPFHGEDQMLFVAQDALSQVVSVPEMFSVMPHAPLTLFGFAVNGWLGTGNAAPLHAINLLMHLGNAAMIYLVARRLVGRNTPEPVSMLAGLLFAVHPVLTEGVDYLAGRPGVQAAFFGLASMLAYLDAASGPWPRYGRACAALGLYMLASGSLLAALPLPVALIGAEWVMGGRESFGRNRLIHGMFLFAMAAAGTVWWASGGYGEGVLGQGLHTLTAIQSLFFMRLAHAFFIPAGMEALNTLPPDASITLPGLCLFFGLLLAAGLALWRRSAAGVAFLWALTMAFAAACVCPPEVVLADRQLYLPASGLVLVVPWIFAQLRPPAIRVAAGLAVATLVLLSGYATYQRTGLWADPVALWTDAAANNQTRVEPWRHLARFLTWQAGLARPEEVRVALERQAEQAWRSAAQLAPDDGECLAQRGILLGKMGDKEQALPMLKAALRANPFDGNATLQLALLCEEQAQHASDSEPLRAAYAMFRRAERLGNLSQEAQARYGLVCGGMGDFTTCVQLLRPIAGEAPDSPFAPIMTRFEKLAEQVNGLEQTAQRQLADPAKRAEGLVASAEAASLRGDFMQAGYYLDMALQRVPDNPQAWALLGVARARMESADSFLREWGTTLKVSPEAWQALAARCASVNAWEGALAYLQFGAGVESGSITPYMTLADTALSLRQVERAEALLHKAAELAPGDPLPWLKLSDTALAVQNTGQTRRYLEEAVKRGVTGEELQRRQKALDALAPASSKPAGTMLP